MESASERALQCTKACVEALDRGDTAQAISLSQQAVDLDPSQSTFHLTLVMAFLKAGQRRKAETALKRAMDLFPADPDVIGMAQFLVNPLSRDEIDRLRKGLRFITLQEYVANNLPTRVRTTAFEGAQPIEMMTIDGATLMTPHGVVVTAEGEVLVDSAPNLVWDDGLKDLIATLASDEPIPVEGICLPLSQIHAHNFWHWFMDSLPRVLIAEACGAAPSRYIIPEELRFARESLTLLGVSEQQIVEEQLLPFRLERAFVPLLSSEWRLRDYPTLIRALRERLLSACGVSALTGTRRIYLSRSRTTGRHISNEADLIQLLERYGFETLYPEDLSLRDQIRAAAEASIFLSGHGAGMVHTLFMPEGATVIELFNPTYVNPCMLPVADLLKHDYYMIPSYRNEVSAESGMRGDIHAYLEPIELILKRR